MNPILLLREKSALTRKQLSMAAGVPYATLAKTELGYTTVLSDKLASALGRILGVNPGKLQTDYSRWRSSLMD